MSRTFTALPAAAIWSGSGRRQFVVLCVTGDSGPELVALALPKQ